MRVRVDAAEHALLRSIAEELRAIVAGSGPPEVRERLFPPAYDDPEPEAEYRQLTGDALTEERVAAVDSFAATLDRGQSQRRHWMVELSPEEADAWLSAVNDARLTLGVLLGIDTQDDWEAGPDPSNTASVALYYLGWLEDELVQALAGGLGSP